MLPASSELEVVDGGGGLGALCDLLLPSPAGPWLGKSTPVLPWSAKSSQGLCKHKMHVLNPALLPLYFSCNKLSFNSWLMLCSPWQCTDEA